MPDAVDKLMAELRSACAKEQVVRSHHVIYAQEAIAFLRAELEQVKRDKANLTELLDDARNGAAKLLADRIRAETAERLAGARVKALVEAARNILGSFETLFSLAYNRDGAKFVITKAEQKRIDALNDALSALAEPVEWVKETEADGSEYINPPKDWLAKELAEPAGEVEPVADEDEREDRIAALSYPDEAPASEVLAYMLSCARLWVPEARIIGNARAGDIVRALTTPPASAIREALEKLLTVAEKQKAYHNTKQHEFPSIEQCTDENGRLNPSQTLYALLQGEAYNGRYTEADWWVCTIRAEIAALAGSAE